MTDGKHAAPHAASRDRRDATQNELFEWRGTVDAFMQESKLHRQAQAVQMNSMRRELEENTRMTSEMHDDLGEALPVLKDLGATARTIKRLGKLLKPMFYIVAGVSAVWVFVKTGRWEIQLP